MSKNEEGYMCAATLLSCWCVNSITTMPQIVHKLHTGNNSLYPHMVRWMKPLMTYYKQEYTTTTVYSTVPSWLATELIYCNNLSTTEHIIILCHWTWTVLHVQRVQCCNINLMLRIPVMLGLTFPVFLIQLVHACYTTKFISESVFSLQCLKCSKGYFVH